MAAAAENVRPLQAPAPGEPSELQKLLQQPALVRPGYEDSAGYELLKKMAVGYSKSTLVPEPYRDRVQNKKTKNWEDNPQGLPNCMIALNMALRMGADPLMVMQNLYVVEGRPSWSAQYVIAAINRCGRYSPLRFEISEPGPERDVEYEVTKWVNNTPERVKKTARIRDRTCRAWAIEKATGERLQGSEISMAMAVQEQWLTKSGSKWITMPEQMLMYRAAAFFGRIYAPELLMGIPTHEEVEDIAPPEPQQPEHAPLSGLAALSAALPPASEALRPGETMDAATGEIMPDPPAAPADDPVADMLTAIREAGDLAELEALRPEAERTPKPHRERVLAAYEARRAEIGGA